jgi:hypothetical protein
MFITYIRFETILVLSQLCLINVWVRILDFVQQYTLLGARSLFVRLDKMIVDFTIEICRFLIEPFL